VLPGRGYGPLGPALLVPTLAAEQVGASIERVSYVDASGAPWNELRDDALGQINAHIDAHGCTRLTIIAKSLGTRVVADVAPRLAAVDLIDVIWLTPLFGYGDVRDGAITSRWRSLIVAGTADPYHDDAAFGAVAALLDAETLLIADADHSLEIAGDVLRTVDGFRALAETCIAFLTP